MTKTTAAGTKTTTVRTTTKPRILPGGLTKTRRSRAWTYRVGSRFGICRKQSRVAPWRAIDPLPARPGRPGAPTYAAGGRDRLRPASRARAGCHRGRRCPGARSLALGRRVPRSSPGHALRPRAERRLVFSGVLRHAPGAAPRRPVQTPCPRRRARRGDSRRCCMNTLWGWGGLAPHFS